MPRIYTGSLGMSIQKAVDVDSDGDVWFLDVDDCGDNYGGDYIMERDEAIAAARAILKHFDVDYDLSDRYRPLTAPELAKFLAENPNYKLIPKEAYEPDAPLTSELSRHFMED